MSRARLCTAMLSFACAAVACVSAVRGVPTACTTIGIAPSAAADASAAQGELIAVHASMLGFARAAAAIANVARGALVA